MQRRHLIPFFYILFSTGIYGQVTLEESPFSDVVLRIDTMKFTWSQNTLLHQDRQQLAFRYNSPNAVAEILLPVERGAVIEAVQLLPNADYTQLDSLMILGGEVRFRIRFNNIHNSDFLRLSLRVQTATEEEQLLEVPLFPYTKTTAQLHVRDDELFLNEEKTLELNTDSPENIEIQSTWAEDGPIHYRITREGNRLLLHLLPRQTGRHTLNVNLKVKKPRLVDGRPTYTLPPLQQTFTVKRGRLAFLSIDRDEVTLTEGSTEAIEVQLDDHRMLEMGKTYRIENQEEPGGALIAELFTRSELNNDKVLCLLRPYGYHRKTEGYLYIKDGDRARFLTNFNVTPKTRIERIFIQREGGDWRQTNKVYPGEVLNLRFEGQGLHKGEFTFYGAPILVGDSLVRNENVVYYRIKVPLDITTREIEIFNNNRSTGKSLEVQEYHRPRPFDFVDLHLGLQRYQLNEVNHPIYYEKTLSDVVVHFDERKIDRPGNLHGKQHLTIRVKISNKDGNLIELYEFSNVVICPGENSPRFVYYDEENCRREEINLNNYITRKTHDLPEWSRIELEFSHDQERYGGNGMSKTVEIILKRRLNFDIDVSFPAGLLILKEGENDFTNFGGISFAMIAQMSFYHPDKIATYRPYKIGAGFIALDAFNFSDDNSNRDVGLVVLGSLYPTSSENKLSFPLYAGYGYLLKQQKGFFLIGPGIRVRF